MLTNATAQKLIDLGCKTMAEALSDQLANPGGFAEPPSATASASSSTKRPMPATPDV